MRYLALIYSDETAQPASPEEGKAAMDRWWGYTNDLQKSGVMLAGEALQPTDTATTVRFSDGGTLVNDGPYTETKEQLGGFYMYECENLDQAIEWASKMPVGPGSSIELRPVMELGDYRPEPYAPGGSVPSRSEAQPRGRLHLLKYALMLYVD